MAVVVWRGVFACYAMRVWMGARSGDEVFEVRLEGCGAWSKRGDGLWKGNLPYGEVEREDAIADE